MSFYFSLYQLIESVEQLERDVQHLAGRALRISPREARANRELLEQCEAKMREAKNLLNNKTHISKITLRKASLLFQVLEVSYRRLVHLAGAAANAGPNDEGYLKAVWQLLPMAQRHYQTLLKTLFDSTGVPVTLSLNSVEEKSDQGLSAVLQKESAYQLESLKLLEKAIEVFGEEQDLADTLVQMRKELLDAKRRIKHLAPVPAEKPAFPKDDSTPVRIASPLSTASALKN